MGREALLIRLQTWDRQAHKLLAALVDEEEGQGQKTNENTDENKNAEMAPLVGDRENPGIGQHANEDEDVESLQALVGVEPEVFPEVLLLELILFHLFRSQLDEAQLALRQIGHHNRHASIVPRHDAEIRRAFEALREFRDAARLAPVRERAVVPVGE